MDERLRHLKGSMKQSVFQNLQFTDKHKQAIKRQIKQENILLPALQLLSVEKNGIELVQKLRSRGIQEFDEQEGFVYILLHQLEQKSYVTSRWKEDQKKYYQLNSKGKKVMKSLENGSQRSAFVLQGLLGGGQ